MQQEEIEMVVIINVSNIWGDGSPGDLLNLIERLELLMEIFGLADILNMNLRSSQGLADEQIEQLTRKQNQVQNPEEQCQICLEIHQQDQILIELSCLHSFHEECIKVWLKQQGTCPCCRSQIGKEKPI